jgi:hypothetical protein
LEVTQGTPIRLAPLDVAQRLVEAPLREAERLGGDVDPVLVQQRKCDTETVSHGRDDVVDGHPGPVETEEIGGHVAGHVVAFRDAVLRPGHEEGGEVGVHGAGVGGAGDRQGKFGVGGVADVGLLAAEQPAFVGAHSARGQAGQVGAAGPFADRYAQRRLAADEAGQVPVAEDRRHVDQIRAGNGRRGRPDRRSGQRSSRGCGLFDQQRRPQDTGAPSAVGDAEPGGEETGRAGEMPDLLMRRDGRRLPEEAGELALQRQQIRGQAVAVAWLGRD